MDIILTLNVNFEYLIRRSFTQQVNQLTKNCKKWIICPLRSELRPQMDVTSSTDDRWVWEIFFSAKYSTTKFYVHFSSRLEHSGCSSGLPCSFHYLETQNVLPRISLHVTNKACKSSLSPCLPPSKFLHKRAYFRCAVTANECWHACTLPGVIFIKRITSKYI
jgi:hypothetical protein